MNREEFEAVLAEADMTADELTNNFRELTVEDFEQMDEPAQEVLATLFELSEGELDDSELGKFFSEEPEQVNVYESIVTNALQGNIVDTQAAFNDALEDRIASKIDELKADMESRLFEQPEVTALQVMEEQELSVDELEYAAENMSVEQFEALNEDQKELLATYIELSEDFEGDDLITELSRKTLANYVKKASTDRANSAVETSKAVHHNSFDVFKRAVDKHNKRKQGIDSAVDKLANVHEDEQIDEISQEMKDRYTKASLADIDKGKERIRRNAAKHKRSVEAEYDAPENSAHRRKMYNRYRGVDNAS